MQVPLFYKSKALFGLDIGRGTVKIVQLEKKSDRVRVVGYGYGKFDETAAHDGIIDQPQTLASIIAAILKQNVVGRLTTSRIVASLPVAHIYTRILNLPALNDKDVDDAIKLEAEQYIPIPVDELYLEYRLLPLPPVAKPQASVAQRGVQAGLPAPTNPTRPVLMVATPKKIVSSYIELFNLLKLEAAFIEPNMFANLRAIDFSCPDLGSKVVIDVGARSSDMAIYSNVVQLVSTLAVGGQHITEQIAQSLKLPIEQAGQLKIHYGIAKSRWQANLAAALEPILSNFANEVQKMVRYYHEHNSTGKPIDRIVLVGGGANMPGLADFLTHLTGVGTLICNPWQNLRVAPLQPPPPAETTIYATAIGLALKEFDKDD